MHYYQFNIGDYASATAHLEPLEDLAYRRLLDLYYSSEMPIPLDLEKVARLIRMRPHSDCIAVVLSDFFTEEKDGYHCTRVDVEIFKYKEKSQKASDSAKFRWSLAKEKQQLKELKENDANALKAHSEGNANQEPLTANDQPSTIAINRFNEFWDLYGKKVDTKKCKAKFDKLSESSVDKIFEVLPGYIESTPDKQYRKLPVTWLNGECWNDEVEQAKDLIDHLEVIQSFNDSMRKHKEVPVTIDTTPSRIRSINMLVENRGMTIDGFKAYFDHVSRNDQLQYFLNGLKIPARGIDHFLKDDVFLSIKEAKATNK